MGYVKSVGVVIKEVNTGEADKVVTILTRSHGKISGYAKGARRPKSPLVGGTQLFCYSELMMFKGKELYTISGCEIIETFYEIRNDLVKLTHSAHIADIINDVMQEEQPAGRILQLFLNTMHMLAKTDRSPMLLTRIFELRFLSILGYTPYVKGCMECNNDDLTNSTFSFNKCGVLCTNCRLIDSGAIKISSGTVKALQHIVYSRINDLFNFSVSDEVLNELSRISKRYLKDRLEKDYTKLDFLKEFEL